MQSDLHDDEYFNMWLNDAEGAAGTLTFDLGDTYNLASTDIWQYNAVCCGFERGVQNFRILTSTNGVDFTYLKDGMLAMSQGGQIAAQNIEMSVTARYVRFEVISNYGDSTYTGLSEVKFTVNEVEDGCDLNGDGGVNATDAYTFMQGCLNGTATWECDQNGNGVFNPRLDFAKWVNSCRAPVNAKSILGSDGT